MGRVRHMFSLDAVIPLNALNFTAALRRTPVKWLSRATASRDHWRSHSPNSLLSLPSQSTQFLKSGSARRRQTCSRKRLIRVHGARGTNVTLVDSCTGDNAPDRATMLLIRHPRILQDSELDQQIGTSLYPPALWRFISKEIHPCFLDVLRGPCESPPTLYRTTMQLRGCGAASTEYRSVGLILDLATVSRQTARYVAVLLTADMCKSMFRVADVLFACPGPQGDSWTLPIHYVSELSPRMIMSTSMHPGTPKTLQRPPGAVNAAAK